MSLLGHKTDIMFRRHIQKHDDRLVEAATRLAKRPKELSGAGVQGGNRCGHRDNSSVSGIHENSQINSMVGGVAERLKAPVLKTGGGVSRPWVRIPPPPPSSSPGALEVHHCN
jgi:hypothetical protein